MAFNPSTVDMQAIVVISRRSMELSEGEYASQTLRCADESQENEMMDKGRAHCGDDSQNRDMTHASYPKKTHGAVNKNCNDGKNHADSSQEEMACAHLRKKPHIDENQRCHGSIDDHSQDFQHQGNRHPLVRYYKKVPTFSGAYRLYRNTASRAFNRIRRHRIITRSITTMFTRSGGKYPNNQPNIYSLQLISSNARTQKISLCTRVSRYLHHNSPQPSSQILHAIKTRGQEKNGSISVHYCGSGDSAVKVNKDPSAFHEDIAVKYLRSSPNYTSLLNLGIRNEEDQTCSDRFEKLTLCQDLKNAHSPSHGHSKPCFQETNCSPQRDSHYSSRPSSSSNLPSNPYFLVHPEYSSAVSPSATFQPCRSTQFPSCSSNTYMFEGSSKSPMQHPTRSPKSPSPPYSPLSPKYSSFPSPSASPSQLLPSVGSPNWSSDVHNSKASEYRSPSGHGMTHSPSSSPDFSESPSTPSCIPISTWTLASPISSKHRLAPIQKRGSQITQFPSRPVLLKMSSPSSEGMQTRSKSQARPVSATDGSPPFEPCHPNSSNASRTYCCPIATKQTVYTASDYKFSPLSRPKSPSFPSRPLSLAMSRPSSETCYDSPSHAASSPSDDWTQHQNTKFLTKQCHPSKGNTTNVLQADHNPDSVQKTESNTRNGMLNSTYFLQEEAFAVSSTRIRRIPQPGADTRGKNCPDEQGFSEESQVTFSSEFRRRTPDDLSRPASEEKEREPRYPATKARCQGPSLYRCSVPSSASSRKRPRS